MEYISLSKAAVLIGKSKSTILEYIRNGKLKANKNEKGVYNIVKEDLFITFASNDIERTKKQNLERHIDIAILQEKLDCELALRKSIENERDFLREQLKEAGVERRMLNNKLSRLETKYAETDFESAVIVVSKEVNTNKTKKPLLWQKIFKK